MEGYFSNFKIIPPNNEAKRNQFHKCKSFMHKIKQINKFNY